MFGITLKYKILMQILTLHILSALIITVTPVKESKLCHHKIFKLMIKLPKKFVKKKNVYNYFLEIKP